MTEAHEIIDVSSDEEELYEELYDDSSSNMPDSDEYSEYSEPGYSPASPSDSIYNNTLSDSDEYPEPGYSPASPSDSVYNNNALSDSDEYPEPGYNPASPSDSIYYNALTDSDEYPEPGYSPASPSDSIYHNSLSDSDESIQEVQNDIVLDDSAGIKEKIEMLILQNEKSTAESHQFSRICPVCLIQNPNRRAVFFCGHLLCLACAEILKNDATREDPLKCPSCRTQTDFVPIFETAQ